MTDKARKAGRPKSIDPGVVAELAMRQYWSEGVQAVSVNRICEIARVSKPSLYREFGSEDGLLAAAIRRYDSTAIQPMIELLVSDRPVDDIINDIVATVTQDGTGTDFPAGCMVTPMFDMRGHIGPQSQTLVDDIRTALDTAYAAFVGRAVPKHAPGNRAPRALALFLASAVASAMRAMMRGDPPSDVEAVLRVAFSVVATEPGPSDRQD